MAAGPAHAAPVTAAGIVNLALANVNAMACSQNSLGGTGFGTSCTGNGGQPEYWCADFAKWVWANAGVQNTVGLTPAAHSFYTYGVNNGLLTNQPAVGDAVVFSNSRGDTSTDGGGIHHVAIVSAVNSDGSIQTISGDWGGQDGTEAHFAGTSHVVLNTPAYNGAVGTESSVMGMWIEGYVTPPGLTVPPPPYSSQFIGVLHADGSLQVKQGLDGTWHDEASGVSQFRVAGNRIAVLDKNGAVSAKDGLDTPWHAETTPDVTDVQITPTMIGVLHSDGSLQVKDGLDDTWHNEYSNVASFRLTANDGIAVLDKNGAVHAKYGLDTGWHDETTGDVVAYAMTADNIGVLHSDGSLQVKDGLDDAWHNE